KEESSTQNFLENIKAGRGWTLNQDEMIMGDLCVALKPNQTLDLNGYALEIEGNLEHIKGELNLNGGSLIVHGDYCMKNSEEDTYGSVILNLKDSNDYVCVEGDMKVYTSWSVIKHWFDGILHLKGNLECQTDLNWGGFQIDSSSNCKIILDGEENQTIRIQSEKVQLPEISIWGQPGRTIEVQFDTALEHNQMIIQKVTNEIETILKLDEQTRIEILDMKDDLNIQSNCIASSIKLNGNCLMVEQNLKLNDRLLFNGGRVYIGGSLTLFTTSQIEMKKNEDILQIENDLKLNQCMSLFLERGQVIVGGNIEQRGNRLFETGEALQLILLGTQDEHTTIIGNNMNFKSVYLVQAEEQYQFSKGTTYHLREIEDN
ncbi:MAG: hypothetical protein J6F30_10810, partial [Cellulosilyticum sp.]|nr:hypothetical protein [Cellulosilyticum sp.]